MTRTQFLASLFAVPAAAKAAKVKPWPLKLKTGGPIFEVAGQYPPNPKTPKWMEDEYTAVPDGFYWAETTVTGFVRLHVRK